jgi:hypothetical protein
MVTPLRELVRPRPQEADGAFRAGYGTYYRWLTWLADPQRRGQPPPAPISTRQVRMLTSEAERHGVLPAVLRALTDLDRTTGPITILRAENDRTAHFALRAVIEDAHVKVVRQVGLAELLRHVQSEIVADLNARGIPVMVIKGSTFADSLYPDAVLRPFTDIDLLVSERDAASAGEVLIAAGLKREARSGSKHGDRYAEEKWSHPVLGRYPVELHWDLLPSPKLRRAISISFEDLASLSSRAPVTSLLLIAAIHGAAGHGFENLRQVIDVAQAARRTAGSFDPAPLLELAERTNSRAAIVSALLVAGRILNDPDCKKLAEMLGIGRSDRFLAKLLSPEVVLWNYGSSRALRSWRRQAFREALVWLSRN